MKILIREQCAGEISRQPSGVEVVGRGKAQLILLDQERDGIRYCCRCGQPAVAAYGIQGKHDRNGRLIEQILVPEARCLCDRHAIQELRRLQRIDKSGSIAGQLRAIDNATAALEAQRVDLRGEKAREVIDWMQVEAESGRGMWGSALEVMGFIFLALEPWPGGIDYTQDILLGEQIPNSTPGRAPFKPDAVLPKMGLILEWDGQTIHGQKNLQEEDRRDEYVREWYQEKYGHPFELIRISESDLRRRFRKLHEIMAKAWAALKDLRAKNGGELPEGFRSMVPGYSNPVGTGKNMDQKDRDRSRDFILRQITEALTLYEIPGEVRELLEGAAEAARTL